MPVGVFAPMPSVEGMEQTMWFRLRNAMLAVVLLGAALATWYLRQPTPEPAPPPRAAAPASGYYLSDAVLLGTGADGRVLYEVSAGRAEERPPQNGLLLTEVRVEYHPVANVPWRVTAAQGEAPADGSHLVLRGGVELASHPKDDGTRPTVIRADTLTLEAEAFVARSDEAVSVFVGSERLDAVGMVAYLKDDRLELESEVHGLFPP